MYTIALALQELPRRRMLQLSIVIGSWSPYMYLQKVLSISKQNLYQSSLLNSHRLINF